VHARIVSLMQALPASAFERVLELMIRPFLLSLCDLLPSLFPALWVSHPPPPPPDTVSTFDDVRGPSGALHGHLSMRRLFVEMCRSVERVAKSDASGTLDVIRLISDITIGGVNIYSRLISRRRFIIRRAGISYGSFRVRLERLDAMIQSIGGIDVVFHRIQYQILLHRDCRPPSYTPSQLCRFACSIGRVEHMAHLARRIVNECVRSGSEKRYLTQLVRSLDGVLSAELEVRLAVGMALHPRLGAASGLAVLGSDLLPMCIHSSICRPICSWQLLLE
jgi:hypothetical protein